MESQGMDRESVQRLQIQYQGRPMNPNKTLEELGVEEQGFISVYTGLKGGTNTDNSNSQDNARTMKLPSPPLRNPPKVFILSSK